MMQVVVDDKNVNVIVQALLENVKSNQHRLDEIQPIISKMAIQTDRLDALLVRNGYAKAVETNTKELKEFRGEFQEFKLNREESCPVAKRSSAGKKDMGERRSWKATVIRLVFGGIGTVSTMIVIAEKMIG